MKEVKIPFINVDGSESYLEYPLDTKSILIKTPNLKSIDLTNISQLVKGNIIQMNGMDVEVLDLSPLSRMTTLKNCDINFGAVESLTLFDSQSLEEFHICIREIDTIDLAPLSSSPEITNIILEFPKLSSIDLQPLAFLPSLKTLELNLDGLKVIDLSPLANSHSLESIIIRSENLKKIDLTPLAALPSLQKLELSFYSLSTLDLAGISHSSIEYLRISSFGKVVLDLRPLSESKIKTLDLEYVHSQNILLPKSETIEVVSFDYCRGIKRIDSSSFGPIPALRTFRIIECLNLIEIHLPSVISQPNLEEIEIVEVDKLETLSLFPLKNSQSLKKLVLKLAQLRNIDLSPLESTTIQDIKLNLGNLEALDFSPLSKIVSLTKLHISGKKIQELDLSPLSGSNLTELQLENLDSLRTLDLAPLADTKLKHLTIHKVRENMDIDLMPLAYCDDLELFHLDSFRHDASDISFLIGCHKLNDLKFNTYGYVVTLFSKEACNRVNPSLQRWIHYYDVPNYYWNIEQIRTLYSFLMDHQEHKWKFLHLINCLKDTLGLEGLGFVIAGERELGEALELSSDSKRKEYILSIYKDQIERGGSSIGLDIEGSSNKYPEITVLVPEILERRKQETENIILYINKDERVEITELFMTAYGFDICKSLQVELDCSVEEFSQIHQAFQNIGVTLKLKKEESTKSHSIVSPVFREYILRLIETSKKSDQLQKWWLR
ncbi:MAG: hypothetical protein GF411_15715 [Candidatus Lokiarchaeota archaeon]|nr:hypothetical protein [Candidatus Lokiarchaeota archaeon]